MRDGLSDEYLTMELFPAIDLRDGKCVRLRQGNFANETIYNDDPIAQAKLFADAGASWIHVVDLDGARSGVGANRTVVKEIAQAVTTPIQTGGGVRHGSDLEDLLGAGVARVVLGTAAVADPAWAIEMAEEFPGRIAVGLDVRGRQVAVSGWEKATDVSISAIAARFDDADFAAFVVTQIDVDGVGTGPDLALYGELLRDFETDIIASGGVGKADHLRELAALSEGNKHLVGAIVGRAIYDGSITVDDALAAAETVLD